MNAGHQLHWLVFVEKTESKRVKENLCMVRSNLAS